ncbi:NAD(P)-binding protein [Vibrio penaeicida]|uniref:FAD-dependent oxidoreductase n=1 Tax=Vibrio penaeicida TaxID=104609 RepID=A0AAV5P084_9VIBR|nr:NAD(P)-binding protein [Vibrio penaeicida]RTZ20146.1 NAD(P)/FAD-dependent oxidoreductase [Vibrio penaeicida]GLQ75993.1 hypothetical protein GCM10007932_53560 [Vibrio penaeicida]
MQHECGNVTNIAVVGGGTSGLATCYYLLQKLGQKNSDNHQGQYHVHLIEKAAELGGNAHTVVLGLGETSSVDSEGNKIEPKTLARWADMGVNDINLSMYSTLKEVMEKTDYYSDENLKPIEDTACFFSEDNHYLYTDDEHLPINRPMERRFSLTDTDLGTVFTALVAYGTEMSEDSAKQSTAWNIELHTFFTALIALAEGYPEALKASPEFEICVEAYNAIRQQPSLADLSGAELAKLIVEMRDNLFYPRVAAMFFTTDKGPQHLPLASPFGYFRYQEGKKKGEKFPDRRYFVGGTKKWIEHLTAYLINGYNNDSENLKLSIHTNVDAKFRTTDTGFTIESVVSPLVDKKEEHNKLSQINFDAMVSTIHANHALMQVAFNAKHSEQGNTLEPILGRVKYTQSIGIVHTDNSVISSNVNSWRTFNVSIRHGETMLPYSITFQENRHQNDWRNPKVKHAPELSYFVTLNPTHPVNDKFVLRTVDSNKNLEFLCGTELTELPKSTQDHLAQSNKKNLLGREDNKAIFYFAHNVYDRDAHTSQTEINKYHENLPTNVRENGFAPIVYAGSWCAEVGLQETCWKQARNAVESLLKTI